MSNKKPLVKRGAAVKHDNHYEAPEVEVKKTSSNKSWKGTNVRIKDISTYNLIRASVKAGLADTSNDIVQKAMKAYISGLDASEKQKVEKIADALAVLNNL